MHIENLCLLVILDDSKIQLKKLNAMRKHRTNLLHQKIVIAEKADLRCNIIIFINKIVKFEFVEFTFSYFESNDGIKIL